MDEIQTTPESLKRKALSHRVSVIVLIGIGVLVIAAIGTLGWRVYRMRPSQQIDYVAEANQLIADIQPSGPDGWSLYYDVLYHDLQVQFESPGDLAEVLRKSEYHELLYGEWDDLRHMPMKRSHNRLRKLVPAIREAAARPSFYFQIPPQASGDLLMWSLMSDRPSSTLRQLGRVLGVDMRRAANSGDWVGFTQNFEALIGMANQQLLSCTMIDLLQSLALIHYGLGEIQMAAFEAEIPEATIDKLLALLDQARRDPAAALPVVEMGRLEQLELAQLMYSSKNPIALIAINVAQAGRFGSHELVEARVNAAFDQLSGWWLMPLQTRTTTPSGMQMISSEPLLNIFDVSQSFERARRQLDQVNVEIQATKILLLLHRHQARTGSWPQSLGDAMNEVEFVDPTTGAPFKFTPAPSEDGLPIVLDWPGRWRQWNNHSLIPARSPMPEPEYMSDWP